MNELIKSLQYSSKDFLTYQDYSLTYKEFFSEVENIKKEFNSFASYDDFILINEEEPIKYYILLFALWNSNKKVVFPNRNFFEGESFNFVKYICSWKKIEKNKQYKNIGLDIDSATIAFSSGSTGKPKGIVHKREIFFDNANSVSKILNVKNSVSVTALKPYLVSAINHLLVHMINESHLMFIDTDSFSDVKNLSIKYENLSYVGSPMHIISMIPYINNKTPDFFFSSGDIFYPSIIKNIIKRFPTTVFFNVYGMAELGGRLFINKIKSCTHEAEYKCIGKNIDNTKIKISNDEVLVKSNMLFEGYITDDNFNQRIGEYFASGDNILKVNDNYEFFGRKNDEIKVLGNKVSMKYLEQKISIILPNTITPIIVNQEHEFFGNIIVLVLYSVDKHLLTRQEILSLLKEKMHSYELPHKIVSINEIPYTQTMKIDRKEIISRLEKLNELK